MDAAAATHDSPMIIALKLFAVFVLVLLNGFFVAAEFALVKIRDTQLEPLIRKGSRSARVTRKIVGNLDASLSACQLGITLASLGLGMYGEHALAGFIDRGFGHDAVPNPAATATVLSLGLLTILHIVVGEMVPKGLALQRPERMIRLAHLPMRVMLFALYPFVAVSNRMARLCLA